MLRSSKELINYTLSAKDGPIGKVKDFFFDDQTWVVRYFVIDTGTWLPGRKVLLIPDVLGEPDWAGQVFPVNLTKEQIQNSPPVEEEKPVSRQNEINLFDYYGWTPYWWHTPGTAGMPGMPGMPVRVPKSKEEEKDYDPRLRSAKEVTGYHIQASDGEIGHVEDFIVEDSMWTIRYIVVDTRNWLPGKKVLVAPEWNDRIDWDEKKVHTILTREKIKNSPEFDPSTPINREYEVRLYDYYGRPKYW